MSIFRRSTRPVTYLPLAADEQPIKPHCGYFRVWLSGMSLARDRDWFANRYPIVHASARLRFADQDQATFTTVARPPEGMLGPGAFADFQLTPLLPYRGGTVELTAGLNVLKGTSTLLVGMNLLSEFSVLVGPPLSQALGVAQKLTDGVTKLLESAGDEALLSLHQGFVSVGGGGENILRLGYRALIRPYRNSTPLSDLSVNDGRLQVGTGENTKPLTGCDYMLLRIEGRRERDDWRFAKIEDLIVKAKRAHFADERKSYEAYSSAALAEVMSCPDLIHDDQLRVVRAIVLELEETLSAPLPATGEAWRDLAGIVNEHAPAAEHFGPEAASLTLEQILRSPDGDFSGSG